MQQSTLDNLKSTLKAELKAEVTAELKAEFDTELQQLRRDVEDLRDRLRVPPEDDLTEVQDAAQQHNQEQALDEAELDYMTWRGFEPCFSAAVRQNLEGQLVAQLEQPRSQG